MKALNIALLLVLFLIPGQVMSKSNQANIYIIQLTGTPLALLKSSDKSTVKKHTTALYNQRKLFIQQLEDQLNRAINVVYEYDTNFHGIAAELSPKEANQISKLPDVIAVTPDKPQKLHVSH